MENVSCMQIITLQKSYKKFYEEILKLKPKEVFAYFNNDFNAYAVFNVLYFKKLFENKV